MADTPQYSLAWTPDSGATTQTVQFRARNTGVWVTNNYITPPNPMSKLVTSASITGTDNNVVYQIQVLSNCCPGTVGNSTMREAILFEDDGINVTASSGVISVDADPLPYIDTITYQLLNVSNAVIQTIYATGADPASAFVQVSAGTYHVKYSLSAIINGEPYTSIDQDDWYDAGSIVIT